MGSLSYCFLVIAFDLRAFCAMAEGMVYTLLKIIFVLVLLDVLF